MRLWCYSFPVNLISPKCKCITNTTRITDRVHSATNPNPISSSALTSKPVENMFPEAPLVDAGYAVRTTLRPPSAPNVLAENGRNPSVVGL